MSTTFEDQELDKLLSQMTFPLKDRKKDQNKKKKIIVLAGPTAVGKTRHSLLLAKMVGGEIVSADSMQVYRGMDIGTAKLGLKERKQIPHHLIDIRDIQESFNVMDFYKLSHKAIADILAREKIPIVVGGTGFYIHALIYGPPQGPASVCDVRQGLEDEVKKNGVDFLYSRLKQADPEYAKTITGADRHKIIRALEIISLTNKKVSDFPKMQQKEQNYDFRCWFLYMPKEKLYPCIEMRCDEMIAAGFIEEVKKLKEEGLCNNHTACQAIGYRQCLDFILSDQSAEEFEKFVANFKRQSRRYAKRQLTWFRKEPLFRWFNVENLPLDRSCETIIQDYELSS